MEEPVAPSEPGSSQPVFPAVGKLDRVQDILDRNRHLLHQIKLNQDAQKPEGLAKNFVLLREINMNIDKVMGLYNAISDDFATFMQHTRPNSASGGHLGSDDADQPAGREAAS